MMMELKVMAQRQTTHLPDTVCRECDACLWNAVQLSLQMGKVCGSLQMNVAELV